jgi:hypothetical protein
VCARCVARHALPAAGRSSSSSLVVCAPAPSAPLPLLPPRPPPPPRRHTHTRNTHSPNTLTVALLAARIAGCAAQSLSGIATGWRASASAFHCGSATHLCGPWPPCVCVCACVCVCVGMHASSQRGSAWTARVWTARSGAVVALPHAHCHPHGAAGPRAAKAHQPGTRAHLQLKRAKRALLRRARRPLQLLDRHSGQARHLRQRPAAPRSRVGATSEACVWAVAAAESGALAVQPQPRQQSCAHVCDTCCAHARHKPHKTHTRWNTH